MKKWLRDFLFGESETLADRYKLAERAGEARVRIEKASEFYSKKELKYMRDLQKKISKPSGKGKIKIKASIYTLTPKEAVN